MKRIYSVYRDLLGILFAEIPATVIAVMVFAILSGASRFLNVWVTAQVLDNAAYAAQGFITLSAFAPYLILFAALKIVPPLISDLYTFAHAEPKSLLVLRTAYKGRMLNKFKTMKYEHIESESGKEIIEKSFNDVEGAARHLFPMYVNWSLSSLVGAVGTLWLFASVRWWFTLTILIPFAAETYFSSKTNSNIYDELHGYWKKEHSYGILAGMLRSREFIKENRLFGLPGFLIDTYKKRLNARNREYEGFYFKNLRRKFASGYILKAAQLGNALALLWLCSCGYLDVGMTVSLTLALFGTLLTDFGDLAGVTLLFRWAEFHFKTYDYYAKFFSLSDETRGSIDVLPSESVVEFDNVRFTYPGADREILKGLTFRVEPGEKVSIVGENGEGKSTMVKLLLGLFEPDEGEIRVGGVPLREYSRDALQRMFGAVFQDFNRYALTLRENVAAGDVDKLDDNAAIAAAMSKAGADRLADGLDNGMDTLLSRDFEGGVDMSGGQWQRIAIARAFMGDKPILILDEPTSQLDPMAESRLYGEFADMSAGKTALFITHRLGSTAITDRVIVISGGRVTQSGSRETLLASGGLYADMWNAQKQWYDQDTKGGDQSA
ncbi:MAG: ABC transporter ATP-binding protein/permease [Oscillospiraceae bacterium]|jgi:ATP-binding cassette subfamily B protein|nr:ABC transporter ATP-binding protein/permease [Oscillospiraceae bacterium]